MKRALAVLVSISIVSVFAAAGFAQTPGPSGQTGTLAPSQNKAKGGAYNEKIMVAAMKEILPTLNLTPDQQTQVDTLNQKTHDQVDQIKKDTKGDKVARRDKMIALGEDFHKQLFTILNPAQTKQFRQSYKAFVKKWREDHKKQTTPAPTAPGTTPPTTTPSTTPPN